MRGINEMVVRNYFRVLSREVSTSPTIWVRRFSRGVLEYDHTKFVGEKRNHHDER